MREIKLDTFLNWVINGMFNLPWWSYVIITLGLTHITILAITIFLHRHQAHRALNLHPVVSHFFRLWLWLTTGMVTKEWAAVHRKHHAFADKVGDPHSPQIYGIKKILLEGSELYKHEAKIQETLHQYGHGTPDDWIERNLYSKYDTLGVIIMLLIDFALFGVIGLSIWAVQMLWAPIFAAGIINGIGHWFGYRNFENPDKAVNIFPWGILIGGEELHNNHHTFATSAKLSVKWYEFDLGWMWIKILSFFGLASVRKSIPVMHISKAPKLLPDKETLEAIITNRYKLAVNYSLALKNDCQTEIARLKQNLSAKISWAKFNKLLVKDKELLSDNEKLTINNLIADSKILQTIFTMREELAKLWSKSSLTTEELIKSLQEWCKRAEASGIDSLRKYSIGLRSAYC